MDVTLKAKDLEWWETWSDFERCFVKPGIFMVFKDTMGNFK